MAYWGMQVEGKGLTGRTALPSLVHSIPFLVLPRPPPANTQNTLGRRWQAVKAAHTSTPHAQAYKVGGISLFAFQHRTAAVA